MMFFTPVDDDSREPAFMFVGSYKSVDANLSRQDRVDKSQEAKAVRQSRLASYRHRASKGLSLFRNS